MRLVAIVAVLALGSGACSDFLTGNGISNDPNAPTAATRDQRLVAVEAAMDVQITGDIARSVCMFVQQCAGTDRQYATRAKYNTTSSDFDTQFTQIWIGGGLVDMRAIQSDAQAAGDFVYEGIGQVLEVLDIGTGADLWGDIPYSQAVSGAADPMYDSQQSIYNALLGVLSQAITNLAGAGSGPGGVDLWYGGDKTKWTQLAHTLRARIYLHLCERDATNYAKALAEAKLGIASSANDFTTYQSSSPTEWNLWYQFDVVQRAGYIAAGAELVDSIMNKRNDPRLAAYFAPITPGVYHGALEGQAFDPTLMSDFAAGRASGAAAQSFRQPLATWAENELMIAEAAYQTGDQVTALGALNTEEAAAGFTTPLVGVSGVALLDSIMVEKYVVMFQNIEAWSDFKRECVPDLAPQAGTQVIARLFYGLTEQTANTNAESDLTNAPNGRNWNDPNPCPGTGAI
ncbi:MAG TPA: SusD/RagB family nutrient-binding outer membrane lipoprotein [Gemmatimonadales bacterium]|nr:SusD/RagB family nutrient-binding outer membrane lipoprotein [Gemmatimonadales bacterium]